MYHGSEKNMACRPGIEKLVVLPCKESLSNSSELLSSPKMLTLVNDLKNHYPSRIIIFDLPPLLSGDDTLVFLPFIESVLLVIEEGKTKEAELISALEMLDPGKFLGTVLNKSESESSY